MKERPILFSGEMVRAILDGRKTMTRRIVKPQPPEGHHCWVDYPHGKPMAVYESFSGQGTATTGLTECPYGQSGDRLWVRETFMHLNGVKLPGFPVIEPKLQFRADWELKDPEQWPNECWSNNWTPSIFMPRWASRITLEIINIRVERLQSISEADAEAEGVESLDFYREDFNPAICFQCGGTRLYTAHSLAGAFPDTDCLECDTHVKRFRNLWDSINGKRASWASSPWVWVVEFQKINAQTKAA